MKKTYISPEALTVCLTMSRIIAQSDPFSLNDTGGTGDLKDDLADPNGEIFTKGYKNIWDTE